MTIISKAVCALKWLNNKQGTKELITYFSNQDEPTIVCIFGDHQPKIENGFVAKTFGTENTHNLTLEQTQARYCTPFYIWANYDNEEKEIEKLSVNYLSSYLMNVISLKTQNQEEPQKSASSQFTINPKNIKHINYHKKGNLL